MQSNRTKHESVLFISGVEGTNYWRLNVPQGFILVGPEYPPAPPSAVLAELCTEPRGPQTAQVMSLEAREVAKVMSFGRASSRVFS